MAVIVPTPQESVVGLHARPKKLQCRSPLAEA